MVLTFKNTKYLFTDFDPSDEKLPNGICSRCRNILFNIDQGKLEPSALDDPIDFSALQFPTLTRSFGGVTLLSDLQRCPCSICTIATAHCGQTGNKFGSKGPFPLGRPPLQGPKRFAASKPIKVCG